MSADISSENRDPDVDDSDEEEEEPRLHYTRLSDLNKVLERDSATCLTLYDRFLV